MCEKLIYIFCKHKDTKNTKLQVVCRDKACFVSFCLCVYEISIRKFLLALISEQISSVVLSISAQPPKDASTF